MAIFGSILYWVIGVYLFVLLARVVLSWLPMFVPNWRPRGPVLVLAEGVYTLTDPPLKWLGKVIPPLRLGNISLDVGFIILYIGLIWLQGIVLQLFR